MTEETPEEIVRAFERTDGIELEKRTFRVTTTAFESTVEIEDGEGKPTYVVTVMVPTLDAATAGEVGPTVARDWRETLERRLAEAPKATRATVELDGLKIEEKGDELEIQFAYGASNPRRGADIAKTFVEYVEGTYVEGIIPGYEYTSPVDSLLSDASQSGESGTPL